MNSANPSPASRKPSSRFPLVLTLTLALSLLSCSTPKHLTTQTTTSSNESSISDHQSILDTIHTLVTETLWLPPDTLGRQYPARTIRTETGRRTATRTAITLQTRDTLTIRKHDETTTPTATTASNTSSVILWTIVILLLLATAALILIRLFSSR